MVLFTDDAPIGLVTPLVGSDPWKVSDLFRQEEIILVVVGVERSIAPFEEFYWALTEKTGNVVVIRALARRLRCASRWYVHPVQVRCVDESKRVSWIASHEPTR